MSQRESEAGSAFLPGAAAGSAERYGMGLSWKTPSRELGAPFPSAGQSYDATGPLTAGKTLACPVNANFLHTESFVDFVPAQNIFVTPTISIPLRTRASLAPEKPVLPILD